jgi:putative toxin-antitoxin system antitoxin component (TIGR02293 family)
MVAAQKIADVLGGPAAFKKKIRSLRQLSEEVERGLPKSSLRAAVEHVAESPAERRRLMFRVVPEPTYKRRRELLSPEESERTERLARVIATSEYVWDDDAQSRRFLNTPHAALLGRSPLDAASTELGARQVEELLGRILHGLPA